MAKINILDSSVYNRIAAGEVVDRPYSVVKEFVENSIDAGATKISISIERGGKDLISVSDDGNGIGKEDLPAAFLPHATSKIARAEDLDRIMTLGFRGEALASIGSVARVTLRSRARGAGEAYEICCEGGTVSEVRPCALGDGTEITAENLFYNTPVRAKFMRTDKGEEGEITNFVQRFVLGNPSVSFTYTVDGKLFLQSYGGGLEEAVAAVYGASVIAQCYQIDAVKHGIRIRGYIGKPDFTKANRTYQSAFVNGRYVMNNTVSSAISNAYASYLMKRQYPFYILFIDVPPEIVDVNVHPNKADVRFENNQVIYGCIYSVISAVLDGNASALNFIVGNGKHASVETEAGMTESRAAVKPGAGAHSEVGLGSGTVGKQTEVPPPNREERDNLFRFPRRSEMMGGARIEFRDSGIAASRENEQSEPLLPEAVNSSVKKDSAFCEEEPGEDIFAENKRFLEERDKKAAQQKLVFEQAIYKGELFRTYLLYEAGDDAYIIDQHAAHERLIFDRLKEEMEHRRVVRQPMLVPYVLNLNAEEFAFFSEHLQAIGDIGFEIEEFGAGSFKISAVPLDLQDIDLTGFFGELLKEVGSLRAVRLSDLLRDKIAMTACKHAVKGGMALTAAEKEKLFEMLRGDMGLKCPHGRPIAVRLTKYEIEKMFKRIV